MLIKENIKKYDKIHREMIVKGFKERKIMPYPNVLFDYLRPYSVGGLPASIKLFINDLCNGRCYDSALLMQLAFENCKVVHADIESLRQIYSEKHEWEHAFVEVTEDDGKKYVVDTSIGLIFDKDYYYEMEKPEIHKALSKKECMECFAIKEILAADFEKEKYALPMVLPIIESNVESSNNLGTALYRNKLKEEISLFKEAIKFDDLVKEINEDMELMRTNPEKLDEKFGIVRDRYHNEVSRGGEKNPYYTSPEEIDYMQSIKDDEKKLEEYSLKKMKQTIKIHKQEDKKILKLAATRLKEILKNPTMNVYESQ